MVLSDKRILEELETGNVVIEPFQRRNLATSSYDVSLGEWYFREKRLAQMVYNIWSEREVEKVWGTVPCRAEPALPIMQKHTDVDWSGVKEDDRLIMIAPGETILCHTLEYIGGRNIFTTQMKARSSMGRNFIAVCKCAGWGDVGFVNRWTMEVSNFSSHFSIPLVVGRRIAQIVFDETGPIIGADYATSGSGKYQTATDLKEVVSSWNPKMMLPRLYRDPEAEEALEAALKAKEFVHV